MNKNSLVPYVIEKEANGERSYDLYSRLLKDRIIMINGEVTQQSMNIAVGELLFLNSQDNEKPIFVYIQSPGGSVQDGMAFIACMKYVTAPVYTICIGEAASMGAAILSAGEPGHRYALRHSSILVHRMSGGSSGVTEDNIVSINYQKRLNNLLHAEIGHNCGRISDESYKEIIDVVEQLDNDRDENMVMKFSKKAQKELDAFKKEAGYDHWMFPQAALRFGIIDKILEKESDLNE